MIRSALLQTAVLGLAVSGIALPSLASAAEGEVPGIRRFALVVGANDGGEGRVVLRYAQDDAKAFLDVMTELGGVRPSDAMMLVEPDAEDFKRAMYRLSQRVDAAPESRTEVVFYYSGHSDERGLLLRGDRVPYGTVRDSLDAVPSDVHIAVVDSCASGAMTRTKGGTAAPAFMVDESRLIKGHAYLTSASADEAAQEADRLLGSFFTHALVTGLRGAADVSGDNRVSLEEAYDFAQSETLRYTENTRFGPQHAERDFDLAGAGTLVMTDLSAVEAGLVLEASLAGRLSVRDNQGRLIAEVTKTSGRVMELGLGAGRFKVLLEHADGTIYEGRITLTKGASVPLALQNMTRVDRVATAARGDMGEARAETTDNGLRRQGFVAGLWPLRTRDASVGTAITALGAEVGELRGSATSMGVNLSRGDALGPQIAMGGNVAGGSSATQISMGANVAGQDLTGLQMTLGANVVGRDVNGAQVSLGANLAKERVRGVQVSLGGNLAGRDVNGVQVSMGTNLAGGAVAGLQATMGANLAKGPLRGVQVAMGANYAPASSRGLQLALGPNIAGNDFHGAQISFVNIGQDITGAQIGFVNIAREVQGTQIGLVNVAKRQNGMSFGLVQAVKEGQFHGEVWASDTFPANAGVQFGGRRVFTQVHVSGDPRGVDVAYTGAGMGVRIQRLADRPEPGEEPERDGRLWSEVDISAGSIWERERLEHPDLLVKLRGSVGFELAPHLSPQVGVSLNVFNDMDNSGNDSLRSLVFPNGLSDQTRVAVWPSVFAGVQF